MTDRHTGYIVTLEEDIREDDAEDILSAIKQIRHVADAEPIVTTIEIHLAQARIRAEWLNKLFTFYRMLVGGEEGK